MISQLHDTTYSRRGLIRKLAGGAAALALAGAVVTGGLPSDVSAQDGESVSAATVGHFRTTSALNLRSGASLSASVILVIPKGVWWRQQDRSRTVSSRSPTLATSAGHTGTS